MNAPLYRNPMIGAALPMEPKTPEERLAALGPRPPALRGGKNARAIAAWEKAAAAATYDPRIVGALPSRKAGR